MDNLGAYKVCGKRNGIPFVDVQRPLWEEAEEEYRCPVDFVACSENTDPENTICTTSVDSCPITDIRAFESESEF